MGYPRQVWLYYSGSYGFPLLNTFYLCGGMSFGSRDYYNKNWSVPPQPPDTPLPATQRDKMRSSLYPYFVKRQAESLLNGMLGKMYSCMDDINFRKNETNKSFNRLLNEGLSPNKPMALFLIATNRYLSVVDNHQVLAYKICKRPNTNYYNIYNYDSQGSRTSNFYIAVEVVGGNVNMSTLTRSTGKPLLGFFINDNYNPYTPPIISYPLPG
jgi:hypothetical protein